MRHEGGVRGTRAARISLLAAAVLAGSSISPTAWASLPAPSTSFWVRHNQWDRDNLLSIDATGTRLGGSLPYEAPPPAVDFVSPRASFMQVDTACRNGTTHYMSYALNGVPIRADGTFRADIVVGPSNEDPNPFRGRWGPAHTEMHIRGTFTGATRVQGTFWEIVYGRRFSTKAERRRGLPRSRKLVFCRTGGPKRGVRVPFRGVAKPIEWISKNTRIDSI